MLAAAAGEMGVLRALTAAAERRGQFGNSLERRAGGGRPAALLAADSDDDEGHEGHEEGATDPDPEAGVRPGVPAAVRQLVRDQDAKHMDAVHVAAELCAPQSSGTVISFLLEHNADLAQRALGGLTALMTASMSDNVSAVRVLLEAHADPDAVDSAGRTALMIASKAGHVEVGGGASSCRISPSAPVLGE
jgi:hypothetical protein